MSLSKNIFNKIFLKLSYLSTNKYTENTYWLLAERIIRISINLFITIYLVRYLGPQKFGLLSYAISYFSIFSSFASLGLDNILVRELVSDADKKNLLLGTSIYLRLIAASATILLVMIAILVTGEDFLTSILIISISSSVIFQSFNVIDYYFQAMVQSKYVVYSQFVSLIIASVVKILLIYYKANLIYFAITITLESILLALGLYFIYKKYNFGKLNWQFSYEVSKKLLKDSFPLILSSIVIAVYMKIDQIMIKKMLTDSELGFYASAVKVCESFYFIPMALTNSVFPAIINAKKKGEKFYKIRLQQLYNSVTWISIGITIPITIFTPQIITSLYGEKFISASPVLQIYIWSTVATFWGVASSQFLIAENFTKISFYRTLIGMITNVVLNFILIPRIGIIGSAIATLISYSAATFSLVLWKDTYKQIIMMIKAVFLISIIDYWKNRKELSR